MRSQPPRYPAGNTLLAAVLCAALVAPAPAAAAAAGGARSFADMSIEELMNEPVTSVAKRETPFSRSPAAISVVTGEDIARLGLHSLADALRLVPGMNVAQITASKWAISARGFNDQFANKLLVLLDGRTIYTPAFGGVYWESQDVVLPDLDRIEVIRGPGATLWGANAVNGVINIETKNAQQTQGTLVSATAGTDYNPHVSLRHGGQLARDLYYRAYVKYFERSPFVDPAGRDAPDDWRSLRGGFRIDRTGAGADALTLQGDAYRGEVGEAKQRASLVPPFSRSREIRARNDGFNLLGRWSRTLAGQGRFTVQAYYDHFSQNDGEELNSEHRDTLDIEITHHFDWRGHDLMWGAGYRHTQDGFSPNFGVSWNPTSVRDYIVNGFVQDEIGFAGDRLKLTLGTKFERICHSGLEVQPNARLTWMPSRTQTWWAAVSHAVRTPSRFERGARVNVAAFQPSPASPVFLVSLFGNPQLGAEHLDAYELGHRIEVSKTLSLDVSAFWHEYDHLMVFVAEANRFEATPAPAHVLFRPSVMRNGPGGRSRGAEATAHWRPMERWRLTAGYSHLLLDIPGDRVQEGRNPRHQAQLRSYFDLRPNLQINAAIFHVSALPANRVPAYTRLDLGLVWRPTAAWELGAWGQNLLDPRHGEITTTSSSFRTEVPRSVSLRSTWRF